MPRKPLDMGLRERGRLGAPSGARPTAQRGVRRTPGGAPKHAPPLPPRHRQHGTRAWGTPRRATVPPPQTRRPLPPPLRHDNPRRRGPPCQADRGINAAAFRAAFFVPRRPDILQVGVIMIARTRWMPRDDCTVLLRLLRPANALAMETALDTGLRISDVLALRTDQMGSQCVRVRESKTGKMRRVYLRRPLWGRLRAAAGAVYVFEGRDSPSKHRTRQAVYKDVRRAARAMRVQHVGCHTARKVYAVDVYRRRGLAAAQAALGHDRPETTLIYLASELLS